MISVSFPPVHLNKCTLTYIFTMITATTQPTFPEPRLCAHVTVTGWLTRMFPGSPADWILTNGQLLTLALHNSPIDWSSASFECQSLLLYILPSSHSYLAPWWYQLHLYALKNPSKGLFSSVNRSHESWGNLLCLHWCTCYKCSHWSLWRV